ncbi:MAG TPA: VOC family protein [Bdellovibrionota bacterium]|nr:VOC family protein [Bdellovibrionota bacterium]
MTLNRIVIYARNVERMTKFYETHFDFERCSGEAGEAVELRQRKGGFSLLIHPAGKGIKIGQASVKLVFGVPDVEKFCAQALESGLRFGTTHKADGYVFANAKDPEKNSVQVSSRAFSGR